MHINKINTHIISLNFHVLERLQFAPHTERRTGKYIIMFRFMAVLRLDRFYYKVFNFRLLFFQWVTVFELLTPLVLFLILVGLRKNEPIKILGGSKLTDASCIFC